MPEFKIESDRVFELNLTTTGESIQVSNGVGDHAVRYPERLNWLDHLVVFTPVGIPYEDTETGETGVMELLRRNRYFLGAKIVDQVVEITDLHEIYPSRVTESVHDDYLESASRMLELEFGGDDE
jgi:hypothetical protein